MSRIKETSTNFENKNFILSECNETFAIVFDQLNIDSYEDGGFISTTYHEFTGYVSIFDTRNGERLYVYNFTKQSLDGVLAGIEKGMNEVEKSMR